MKLSEVFGVCIMLYLWLFHIEIVFEFCKSTKALLAITVLHVYVKDVNKREDWTAVGGGGGR